MQKFKIEGGHSLSGEIALHGAKNAVLPILAATLLVGKSAIHNCPPLRDVDAALDILKHLHCQVVWEGDCVEIDSTHSQYDKIPSTLIGEMRSSVLFLGAILSRFHHCRINFPGGCELGPRPIDLHLSALRSLGATIREEGDYLDCTLEDGFKGGEIVFPFPSVGATENAILGAVCATGFTTIYNAAQEPEIADLVDFLVKAGGKIALKGSRIDIEGVPHLGDVTHTVMGDRIAAATYLCCSAITKGELLLRGGCPEHLMAVMPYFAQMGCTLRCSDHEIWLKAPKELSAISTVKTMPYPGFPTDAQSPLMAVTTLAHGRSVFVETIFQSRFKQVQDLTKMGAKIHTEGRMAVVEGVEKLHGSTVSATDLRGGASLLVAALAAEGTTTIQKIWHIQRGYPHFEKLLNHLGGKVELVE